MCNIILCSNYTSLYLVKLQMLTGILSYAIPLEDVVCSDTITLSATHHDLGRLIFNMQLGLIVVRTSSDHLQICNFCS